jgi:uncharacterized protein YfaP (DUF2135 family)
MNKLLWGIIGGAVIFYSSSAFAEDPIHIQVLSATVKNKTVPDAQVFLQKEGAASVTGQTDAMGRLTITSPFTVDNNSVTLIIKKNGFSPLIAKCPCEGMTYAISETMTQLDGLRVVLNWGSEPSDLDLHAVFPGNNVFFNHKEGTEAFLDVDDTDSYGPETVTIKKKIQGQKYVFAVHNYVASSMGSTALTAVSRARVFVYIGQSLIRSYYVPTSGIGSLWIVFGIDEQGAFHDINKIIDVGGEGQGSDKAAGIMKGIIEQQNFGPEQIASVEITQQAKMLNKMGEDAYHAKNIEQSIEYYRQAIELDPNFGQAYSNLGLSQMKLNRSAEAIWASRKAIELAGGPTAAQVRASSYYNIGKQYESQSQWADAKQNYELAQQNKNNTIYTKAIQRMEEKLKTPQ